MLEKITKIGAGVLADRWTYDCLSFFAQTTNLECNHCARAGDPVGKADVGVVLDEADGLLGRGVELSAAVPAQVLHRRHRRLAGARWEMRVRLQREREKNKYKLSFTK